MDGVRRVYLLHPNSSRLPGIDAWIDEVRILIRDDVGWDGWCVDATPFDGSGRIEIQPYWVRIKSRPGPLVMVDPHQRRVLDDLAERLSLNSIIVTAAVGDSTDLLGSLEEAKRRCLAGEPLLPRRFIAAVLIVRKLRRFHYWAGNAKGYLWASDLAKGRGVDEKYADVVQDVADFLLTHKILTFKTSQGKRKLALNPDSKPEVHAIADRAEFRNTALRKLLYRGAVLESAASLAVSNVTQKITLEIAGRPILNAHSATAALSEARCLSSDLTSRVVALVHYDDGHCVREEFPDHSGLLKFLEALAS